MDAAKPTESTLRPELREFAEESVEVWFTTLDQIDPTPPTLLPDTAAGNRGSAIPATMSAPSGTYSNAGAVEPATVYQHQRWQARRETCMVGLARRPAALGTMRERRDRRLDCGRPAAKRTSSRSTSRGDPDLGDEPPGHRPPSQTGAAA